MTLNTRTIGFDPAVEQTPAAFGRSHLLTIGIDQYRDRDIRPLATAVRDAKDVAGLLTDKYQFDPNNVQSLFDGAATQKAILKALERLIETVQGGDVVLIYFAGHGILKDIINEGFWIPADAERGDEGSYIANSLIVKYLRSIKSLHTVVIADACFAGAMFGERRLADNAQQRLERLPSRWLITSCRDTPSIDKDNRANSPFADSLLLHLKINEKEALPVSELARSIITDVGNNYEQLPRYAPIYGVEDRGGEFAFRLKGSVAPLPEPKPAPAPNPTPGPVANPTPTPWSRIVAWASGFVAVVLGAWGISEFLTPSPPEKVYLAAQTPTVVLGKIPLGQRDTFEFVVSNVGKTEAFVNEFECKCDYVQFLDTTSAKIPPNESRTYRAVWLGEGQLGSKRCVIVTKGPNVVEAARTLVQAEVVEAPPANEIASTPSNTSNSVTPPPAAKARLALETTDIVNKNGVIDLGEIKQGSERTFAFKIKNLSTLRAEMTTVTSSCGALTAAKGGNNFIAPNGLGSYGGVWKANQIGAQQCTLTINGSNLEAPVQVVVKARVKSATAGGGGTVVPPPRADGCRATCRSKRIGAQITLLNMDTNQEYNATTNAAGEATFSVPCDLIGQTVKIYLRGGGPDDKFNVVLTRFFSTPD
jgi:hypothetical protein